MPTKVYEWRDLTIWQDGEQFYAEYDVGSISEIFRRDCITHEEATLARQGPEQALKMLWGLQQRLLASGIDPYKSNMAPPP